MKNLTVLCLRCIIGAMVWLKWIYRTGQWALICTLLLIISPTPDQGDQTVEQVRDHTRQIEFDYVAWTWNALEVKFHEAAKDTSNYLSLEEQRQVVLQALDLVQQVQVAEAQLSLIYTDPNIEDPETQAEPVRAKLDELHKAQGQLNPLAENVLQEMVADTYHHLGFNPGGQPLPPVLYHSTPLPWALIVSPRGIIRQDANISLETELSLEDRIALEEQVNTKMDMSSLVVPVGGVGVYPTMVAQTTNINWLVEVIAHEWMHNYLTLRPLGLLYEHAAETRTMNETSANIAGKEIGAALIRKYFPEFVPPEPVETVNGETLQAEQPAEDTPPPFDFRAEMHKTRVMVDALLEKGKIEEAEGYMEVRRQFFWDNGYPIRKLNQAYFAFHGAYADQPLGAAGEDPVGAAVRQLRAQSASLHDFIQTMAWLTSYEQLQNVVDK